MQISTRPIRIWDLPTRLFHWLLVFCIVGAFVTVKLGGLYMDWHARFGSAILGLIVFRLVWGCIGPRYARFTNFVHGPRTILAYLRGAAAPAGHNPLGALSVIAFIAVIGFQSLSGLFATDDIMTQGPLYAYVDEDTAATLTAWHSINQWIIVGLVVLHLLAIAWYTLIRRQRLVRAMIAGDVYPTEVPSGTVPADDGLTIWIRGLVLAACVMALVLWIWSLSGGHSASF
jgi:cytochrome b